MISETQNVPYKSGIPVWLKRAFWGVFLCGFWVAMGILALLFHYSKDLPSVETFWTPNRPVSVEILDRHDRLIMVRGAVEAKPVSYERLAPSLRHAILATEDRRFFTHIGVDPIGLARAAQANMKAGRVVQGGSTLTQQLAKNVFLTQDRHFKRKVQESLLALWLERSFSKEELLEKYLSRVYFGGGAWGLEAASEQFLNKATSDLNLPESALLAGLLKAPTNYNPVVHPDAAAKRTATVLKAMEHHGVIDRQTRAQALITPINVYPVQSRNHAGYFVDWIWRELETVIGTPRTDLIVHTTLDLEAQKAAEAAAQAHLDPEKGAEQVALITLDNNGGVRAMVGGHSYMKSQFNRATQAERQPGSAFKPFVYLAAFNADLKPWEDRIDAPITVEGWTPRNFSKTFRGNLTLEAAFALSINTVAVIIAEEIGRERVIETANSVGLSGLKSFPSLSLGAQNVTLLDLTAAYLPFANWGYFIAPHGIEMITTQSKTPVYIPEAPSRRRILSIEVQGHMNRIMRQAVKGGTGRRAQIKGREIGGKTGTTNDYRDAWFVGYVPNFVTGVWVGADDFTPMQRVTGGSIPAKIWQHMMSDYLEGKPFVPLPMSRPDSFEHESASLSLLLDDIELALPKGDTGQTE